MELVKQSGCLSVVTDESTDAQDQYGLHIVFVLQALNGEHASDVLELKAVLADTLYLQAVNYNTVSQAIVKCLNNFDVSAFICIFAV
ncbi:UNVERIFIED_CONTAM: hypothetical protein FKN15_066753 [Acipenser sinensis]